MSLIQNNSYTFKGANKRLTTADLSYKNYSQEVPIVLFLHGFKGFKDWGAWPLVGEIFAVKNYPLLKLNFSHNGTTPKYPEEFKDLEAFGNNNFKLELDDIDATIDFLTKKKAELPFSWNEEIYLIGHSRGGSIALLKAANDERITKCVTWNAVFNLEKYVQLKPDADWKKEGVHFIPNSRTNQQMPMYYQFVETYQQYRGLFDMEENLEKLVTPLLIIHAENDEAVPLSEAHDIYNLVEHAILVEIENTGHTFNTQHPLTERKISKALAQVISETLEFFEM